MKACFFHRLKPVVSCVWDSSANPAMMSALSRLLICFSDE